MVSALITDTTHVSVTVTENVAVAGRTPGYSSNAACKVNVYIPTSCIEFERQSSVQLSKNGSSPDVGGLIVTNPCAFASTIEQTIFPQNAGSANEIVTGFTAGAKTQVFPIPIIEAITTAYNAVGSVKVVDTHGSMIVIVKEN